MCVCVYHCVDLNIYIILVIYAAASITISKGGCRGNLAPLEPLKSQA